MSLSTTLKKELGFVRLKEFDVRSRRAVVGTYCGLALKGVSADGGFLTSYPIRGSAD